MLREPEIDEALTALDRAVVEAVRARLAAETIIRSSSISTLSRWMERSRSRSA